MKQTFKTGITVLVVAALTMSGIALAQTDESTDEDGARPAVTRIVERLQELVDDGTISNEQAQAVAETLADGFHPGGPRGHRAPRLGAVADFLGMDADEFRAALEEYGTLADLAAANGSSADEVIDFLVAAAEDRLAEAVEDGRIEQADADERLAGIEERITEMVNSEIPEPGLGPHGPRAPHGEGFDIDGDEAGFTT